MSKTYSIRLDDAAMSLVRPTDTLTSRMNQILARYAWIQRTERDRVHAMLNPEAWALLRREWPTGHFKYAHPSTLQATITQGLGALTDDAEVVARMTQAEIMVLVEMIEHEMIDWSAVAGQA